MEDLVGQQIGPLRIVAPLGKGGMGVVYEARHEKLGRRVAVKVLREHERFQATARARLLREAQAMARVSHPNVIPIFDVGVWGEQVFLAMELADGGTLSGWLEEEHSWREVLEYCRAAMAFARRALRNQRSSVRYASNCAER